MLAKRRFLGFEPIDLLAYLGILKNLLDRLRFGQTHQVPEVVLEGAEAAARIERIADQNPTLWIDDVVARELRRVKPIGCLHQFGKAAESVGLVVIGDHSRRAGSNAE